MRPRRCCHGFCAALSILHPLFFPPLTIVSLSLISLPFFLLHLSFSFSLLLYLAHSPPSLLHVYNSPSSFFFIAPTFSLFHTHTHTLFLSLCFFLFISLTLCFSISLLPSFFLCYLFFSFPLHLSLSLLHTLSVFFSLFFACLRHSDDSATKLAISQIVIASYRTIDFSQCFCFSKSQKFQSSIQV